MSSLLLHPRGIYHPLEISIAGLAAFAIISLLMIFVLLTCLKLRIQATRNWTWASIPPTTWIIFIIYADSIVFILGTLVVVFGLKFNLGTQACSSASLLGLICYMSTKFIYYYLVEKIYITRKSHGSRFQSKLYCFNVFALLAPYCMVAVLNVIYRGSHVTSQELCIITVKPQPVIVFIILDSALNLYLTILFVVPLREICTHSQARNPLLRTIYLRSMLCCVLTLITTTTNLAVLLGLNGEPAWIFLLCCNIDVVFSVLIRRWVTLRGPTSANTSRSPEDAVVNETNAEAPSFSSSWTAQNTCKEMNSQELVIDANGKIIEVELQRDVPTMETKDPEKELGTNMEFSPICPTPPNSLSTEEVCLSRPHLRGDEFEGQDQQQEEEAEAEKIGRAIITTHISAQKMHEGEFDGSFRPHAGDSFRGIDAEGMVKLGGIRVMIEQIIEVEYESDNGS